MVWIAIANAVLWGGTIVAMLIGLMRRSAQVHGEIDHLEAMLAEQEPQA
jgi:hypothetical protein